jgi:hypothetical protein
MEVRFAYDDTALYVAVRMSAEHTAIQSPLGRRDEGDQSEYVLVALDTYLDHRTAYGFGVTAAAFGSIAITRRTRLVPVRHGSGVGGEDPHPEDGWTAEMWIPLSQLRFNRRDEQVWGLNVYRFARQTTSGITGCRCRARERSGRRGSASCAVSRASPAAAHRADAVRRWFVDAHRQPRYSQSFRRRKESDGPGGR